MIWAPDGQDCDSDLRGDLLSLHHVASVLQPARRIVVNSRWSLRESWQSLFSPPTIFVHHQLPTAWKCLPRL